MTISLSDNDPRISYDVAAGVTQSSFTVPFEFFDLDDLNVYVDGTQKTKTTHYTLASGGSGSTGSITMSVTGATGGSKVVITRAIDHERTTDFQTSGPFNIASLNTELDRFTAIAADLKDDIDRSLRLTDFDIDASLTLPDVDTRKGKTLAFNATTGAVEAGPSITDVQTVSAASADIATLADIEDGTDATDAIQTVAGISSNVSTVAGISGNVTTVAGISSNVTSVAGNSTNINTVAGNNTNISTVAGISSNVTTVAGISSDVTAVAGDATDIGAVAGKATEIGRLGTADAVADLAILGTTSAVSDMNTLAAIASDISSVGAKASLITADFVADLNTLAVTDVINDINTLATSDIVSDLNTLATSDIVSDLNTLATTDIVSDINTLATSDIVADLALLATSDFVSDLNTMATSQNVSNLNSVAGGISNVNTVASNISGVNSFGERYRVSATAPSTSLDAGDLWFDTANNVMKVYGSSGFTSAGSSVNGTSNRSDYVVGTSSGAYTGSTTVFPHTYDAGYVDVYLNGIKLQPADFTATNGTSVTLGSAAQTNDTVSLVGYGTFELSNFAIGSANNVDTTGHLTGHALVYNGTNYVPSDQGIETHLGGDGTNDGVSISDGLIEMRTGGSSPAQIDMYCEVNNAHKVSIKAPAHANYSGNVNFTLPTSNGTNGQVLSTDGSGNLSYTTVDLTALSASNLTSGTIPDARFPATLPAVSGANLTGISTDLVGDTSPQLGGTLDTNGQAIQFGASKWTIELSGNNLLFKYNGTAKIKFAEDGEIVTVDDVTAFGTI